MEVLAILGCAAFITALWSPEVARRWRRHQRIARRPRGEFGR